MKFKHLVAVCLCLLLAGCSTAMGVSKGNIFFSEHNPNIRIQVDPSLIAQDSFSNDQLLGGGDFAGIIKNTCYPFVEVEGKDVKRAFIILFRDMTEPNYIWRSAGDGKEKNISGVSFRIYPLGNFADPGLSKEAKIRGFTFTGPYSALVFIRFVNAQRLMILAYIEKTPSEFVRMYWDPDRPSEEEKEYLEQLELRATEAFTVTSHSTF